MDYVMVSDSYAQMSASVSGERVMYYFFQFGGIAFISTNTRYTDYVQQTILPIKDISQIKPHF